MVTGGDCVGRRKRSQVRHGPSAARKTLLPGGQQWSSKNPFPRLGDHHSAASPPDPVTTPTLGWHPGCGLFHWLGANPAGL